MLVGLILLRFDYTSVHAISLLFGFVGIPAGIMEIFFAGAFDIIQSIAARREVEIWWLQLVGGIIEVALGFWAAGYYGRSSVLLIAWAAAFALIRGVKDFVFAFRVRELENA